MDDSFSNALKEARKARGWTQEDLAKQMGVSQQSVQKWETGSTLPRPARRDALMRALGLQMERDNRMQAFVTSTWRTLSNTGGKVLEPTYSSDRLSGTVREQALFAELEQFLPPEFQQYLDLKEQRAFRFATDYLSPQLAAEIFRQQDRMSSMLINITLRRLWNLATLRQMDLQMTAKERKYVFLVIADDITKTLKIMARWSMEAQLHGLHIEVVDSIPAAAKVLEGYEHGTLPLSDDEPNPELPFPPE